jgi:hypothetical protein
MVIAPGLANQHAIEIMNLNSLAAKVPGSLAGWLCQVTQPPSNRWPLDKIK